MLLTETPDKQVLRLEMSWQESHELMITLGRCLACAAKAGDRSLTLRVSNLIAAILGPTDSLAAILLESETPDQASPN